MKAKILEKGDRVVIPELKYEDLKGYLDKFKIDFDKIEVEEKQTPIGQERATKALEFGLSIKSYGYNIYVTGLPGTGRTSFAKAFAEKVAKKDPIPPDLCYIYNFENPKIPLALPLPAGEGKVLKAELEDFLEILEEELSKLFDSKEFESNKQNISKSYEDQKDSIIKDMTEEAKDQGFGVKTTGSGIYFMPIIEGEMISEEQYNELAEEEKEDIMKHSEQIQKKASGAMRDLKNFEKGSKKDIEDFEYGQTLFIVGKLMYSIFEKYKDNEKLLKFLKNIKEDILENIETFINIDTDDEEALQSLLPWYTGKNVENSLNKYKVNLLTDNSKLKSAPVIVDFNPTYSNLVGEIEYDNEYGNFTTDFLKIKEGLLHKARGGYLILQAHDIFTNAYVWEAIRRSLLTKEINIDTLREYTTSLAVSGIKPEPFDADIKIIIVGTPYYYELIYSYDDEFRKLFKICAEFDYEMSFNEENLIETVKFVKSFFKFQKITEDAFMKILEYSSRISENQEKLSTCFNKITEILTESKEWARLDDSSEITSKHIIKAVREKEYRSAIYEEKLNEMYNEDILLIDTEGKKIGQVNALAVIDMGEYAFAKPSKITATTYLGKSGVINIEKEAEMSGPIHDKGVQVLSGYLGQTYAQDFFLSLSARICFEQNYSGIDGDSASAAELYTLLSNLSELPIDQGIAATGSINQRGEIQAVGGVTYKVEGFFDLCKERGLTGKQGVVIPVQNIKDLVLKEEVVEAIKEGVFHIYPIKHIDEGIEILTGIPAGIKMENGKYPPKTVHKKVYKKLKLFNKISLE